MMETGNGLCDKFRHATTLRELKQITLDEQDVIDALKDQPDQMYYKWAINTYKYYGRILQNG